MTALRERLPAERAPMDKGGQGTIFDRVKVPEPASNMTFAMLGQGQGGQYVGMGERLANVSPAAADVWNTAGRIIGPHFLPIVRGGTKEQLGETDITQPAIVADALARQAALKEIDVPINAGIYTGLSLGFVTAVAFSGAADAEKILTLVKARGDATQTANAIEPSSMMVLTGVDEQMVEDVMKEFDLALCLENSDQQRVYGGARGKIADAIAKLSGILGTDAAKKVRELSIGGAFHSRFMQPAAAMYREAIKRANIGDPVNGRLIGITDASSITTAEAIEEELLRQLTEPVSMRRVLEQMNRDGITNIAELGNLPTIINMNRSMFQGEKESIVYPQENDDGPPLVIAHQWRAAA